MRFEQILNAQIFVLIKNKSKTRNDILETRKFYLVIVMHDTGAIRPANRTANPPVAKFHTTTTNSPDPEFINQYNS